VIDHWPDSEDALAAQLALVEKGVVRGNETFDELVGKLISVFFHNKTSSREVYSTAMRYTRSRPMQAQRLHRYNADNGPKDDPYTLQSQIEVFRYCIREGNEVAADEALKVVLQKFTENPALPAGLCDIAAGYMALWRHEKAKQVYQYVLDRWPGTIHAVRAGLGLASVAYVCGDEQEGLEMIHRVINDYGGGAQVPHSVTCLVAEEYYKLALYKQGVGREVAAKDLLNRALAMVEPLIRAVGVDAGPDAWFLTGALHYDTGNYSKAYEYLERAEKSWPDHERAGFARILMIDCLTRLAELGQIDHQQAASSIKKLAMKLAQDPRTDISREGKLVLSRYSRD